MRIYNYLFYSIYHLLTAFDDNPKLATVIVMSWLFMFNFFSILYFLSFNHDITRILKITASVMSGVIIFGGHFLYFYTRDRGDRIIESFENKNMNSIIIGALVGLIYVILTLWISFKITFPNIGGMLS